MTDAERAFFRGESCFRGRLRLRGEGVGSSSESDMSITSASSGGTKPTVHEQHKQKEARETHLYAGGSLRVPFFLLGFFYVSMYANQHDRSTYSSTPSVLSLLRSVSKLLRAPWPPSRDSSTPSALFA